LARATAAAPPNLKNTRAGGGKETPVAEQRQDVRILDIFGNTASVRIDASTWVDYLHVAQWNGRWVMGNVLWELRPREDFSQGAGRGVRGYRARVVWLFGERSSPTIGIEHVQTFALTHQRRQCSN
jgi:hypothetical protein